MNGVLKTRYEIKCWKASLRKKPSKLRGWLVTFGVFAIILALIAVLERAQSQLFSGNFCVVDGDTVRVDGQSLRLLGVDAPELSQSCRRASKLWSCGRQSRTQLFQLMTQFQTRCRSFGLDRYDRWLVICENQLGEVNRLMVERGWAVSDGDYSDAEAVARTKKHGIWSGTFERPRDWRRSKKLATMHDDAIGIVHQIEIRIRALIALIKGP